jgi:GDP-4-dehydro-6-deoxy-D-mannose reductase
LKKIHKILITGSSGFIGSNLSSLLSKNNYKIHLVNSSNGDIFDNETWKKFPKCDLLIHLAGLSFTPMSWENPSLFYKTNVIGTQEALNYCNKNNAKLLFLSTYLYGNPIDLPINELHDIQVTNPYNLSKKICEDLCKFHYDYYNLDVTILRPFNIFGPGQSKEFIIPKIIEQVNNGNKIEVNNLKPKRDYLYISDLTNLILKSIDNIKGFNIYNVGSGRSVSVEKLIYLISEIFNKKISIKSLNLERKGEVMDCYSDSNKATNNLGWVPQYSLKEGLEKSIKFYTK